MRRLDVGRFRRIEEGVEPGASEDADLGRAQENVSPRGVAAPEPSDDDEEEEAEEDEDPFDAFDDVEEVVSFASRVPAFDPSFDFEPSLDASFDPSFDPAFDAVRLSVA